MSGFQLELPFDVKGEARDVQRSEEALAAGQGTEHPIRGAVLEEALGRRNMHDAWKRVKKNGGSPGIDGMTVEELGDWLRTNWTDVRQQLLDGTYRPQPVRRHEIPKPGGGVRLLGIPTALDRLIQQALLQVLQPMIDPTFSEHSYGFRPGRRAHDAVHQARKYVDGGRRWVVDVDLEKFFDRVNHDILMDRLSRHVRDVRVLRLIRRYLEAGILVNGVKRDRHEGTPQGGPLSPLLANVLLDEVDKDLEAHGHCFVRYADDCNVYVGSKRAGERVMRWLTRRYGRLRLRVNDTKSKVVITDECEFLGFRIGTNKGVGTHLGVGPAALQRMKARVRQMTSRVRGRSLEHIIGELRSFLPGWKEYFQLAKSQCPFATLDGWIRRRLRAVQLAHWKRGPTAYREARKLGASEEVATRIAANLHSWWGSSARDIQFVLTNSFFAERGLPSLAD